MVALPLAGSWVPAQPSLELPPLASQPAFGSEEVQVRVNGTPGANTPLLDVAVMVTVGPVPDPLLPPLDDTTVVPPGPPLAEQPARARPATMRSASAPRGRVLRSFRNMTGSL